MTDRPNEQVDDGAERRGHAKKGAVMDGGGEIEPTKSTPTVRWVQLAYDLEQYGDPDPEERGEVF